VDQERSGATGRDHLHRVELRGLRELGPEQETAAADFGEAPERLSIFRSPPASRAPMDWTCSRKPFSCKVSMTTLPAAVATGLPPKVVACVP